MKTALLTFIFSFLIQSTLAADNSTVVLQPLITSSSVVQFLSFSPSSSQNRDGYVFQMSTNGLPYVRNSYLLNVNSTQTNFSSRVATLRALEFNSTTGYDKTLSNCSMVGQSLYFSPFFIEDQSPYANTTVYNITTVFSGQNECKGLVVTFSYFITTNKIAMPTAVGQPPSNLTTNGVKFTISVQNYPYKMQNSTLALALAFYTRKARFINIDEIQTIPNTVAIAKLKYNTFAQADGKTVAVNTSPVLEEDGSAKNPGDDGNDATESSNLIYFYFNAIQPKRVVWDPELVVIPVVSAQPSEGTQTTSIFNVFMSLAVSFFSIFLF